MRVLWLVVFLGLTAGLRPRRPLTSTLAPLSAYEEQAALGAEHDIIAKFTDADEIRPQGDGTTVKSLTDHKDSTTAINQFLHHWQAKAVGLLETVDKVKLETLLLRAAKRSGDVQPDLLGIVAIRQEEESNLQMKLVIANALQQLPCVEFVELAAVGLPPPVMMESMQVKCEDTQWNSNTTRRQKEGRNTPLFVEQQRYRGADPGMEADYVNDELGGNGRGITLSDCEYSWVWDHEDVYPIYPEHGHDARPDFRDHGIASVGVTKGVKNDIGITGMARDSEVYTFSEYTYQDGRNRARAVAAAAATSGPGDVILLEMQTFYSGRSQYSPAETDQYIWAIVRSATDAGIHVVAAAGNGNENLDGSAYREYMNRGDSGSLIVGAGDHTTAHRKASFSTYGSRVDVQAWGDWSVMTAGYGVCVFPGSSLESRHYTNGFSGTSSASALTSGAVAALLSYANSQGITLDPLDLRDLLIKTGVPQTGTGGHIGPHVNLRKAVEQMIKEKGH